FRDEVTVSHRSGLTDHDFPGGVGFDPPGAGACGVATPAGFGICDGDGAWPAAFVVGAGLAGLVVGAPFAPVVPAAGVVVGAPAGLAVPAAAGLAGGAPLAGAVVVGAVVGAAATGAPGAAGSS